MFRFAIIALTLVSSVLFVNDASASPTAFTGTVNGQEIYPQYVQSYNVADGALRRMDQARPHATHSYNVGVLREIAYWYPRQLRARQAAYNQILRANTSVTVYGGAYVERHEIITFLRKNPQYVGGHLHIWKAGGVWQNSHRNPYH